ncbi:MAG: hypothetical protein QOH73_742 [Gaiellaceae bacterium]|jgi:glycosyltransferase involved in cell wall biosynthesis|nr:hypothetical protein [Gaiellaceae bacterium]
MAFSYATTEDDRRMTRGGRSSLRVGWVASQVRAPGEATFKALPANVAMRVANVGRWINRARADVRNEMYDPSARYDVVVFFKAMDESCQREAQRIRAAGGRVVFDANVNYYEIWGEYDVPGTEPTPAQRQDAQAMTRLADLIVADSSYLLEIVAKLNPRAAWVPDNVDVARFRPPRRRRRRPRLRLVWSGMAPKAKPLVALAGVLGRVRGLELLVVSNEPPDGLEALRAALPCRFERFALGRYAKLLRGSDVIVSPKNLVNGYELGHTEWKITLGMACGLPALASPQRSYVEAIGAAGGGIVCTEPADWVAALERLRDDRELRRDMGERAVRTVRERYSTPVIASQYLELLESLR